jgi:hypothetical protein
MLLLWPEQMPPMSAYAAPLAGAAGFYLVAQLGLLRLLRVADASRVSPLLGVKILIIAVISTTFLSVRLSGPQAAAVGLSVLSAMLLSAVGGRISLKAALGVLGTCVGYALSDLSIQELNKHFLPAGQVTGPLLAAFMTYLLCGVFGLALLLFSGERPLRDIPLAAPFALSWLVSMLCLYSCFSRVGVVMGTILQATRGIISVLLGLAVSTIGWIHIEQKMGWRSWLLRLAAAGGMVGAIALYYGSSLQGLSP